MLILPTGKIEPQLVDPRCLVIYSIPKCGKTTIEADLPGNLMLDLEGGTDYIPAPKLKIIGLKHDPYTLPETEEQKELRHKQGRFYLGEAITALRGGHNYKFLTLDTATMLQDWCEYDATCMYMTNPTGVSWNRYDKDDQDRTGGRVIAGTLKPKNEWRAVTTMGKGYGYRWLVESYQKWVGYIQPLAPTLIINAHIKYSQMTKKEGKEVEMKDLDLTGKLKGVTAGIMADAIGYLYRSGNQCFLSFKPTDEVICGSRIPHLEGKDILISEKLENGTIKTYWHNIFKSLDNKGKDGYI